MYKFIIKGDEYIYFKEYTMYKLILQECSMHKYIYQRV